MDKTPLINLDLINTGTSANDGTGDDLRSAMLKINDNFIILDAESVDSTTAINLIENDGEIFAGKVKDELQFRNLEAGNGITIKKHVNTIEIGSNLQELMIGSDNGTALLDLNGGDPTINVIGGPGINTTISNNVLTITATGEVELISESNPQLSATLQANLNNIENANTITAKNYVGDVHGIDIRRMAAAFSRYDFGKISTDAIGMFEWLVFSTRFDFGTITAPGPITADFGVIS